MDDIEDINNQVPISENLIALLRRLTADENDTLMGCLAADINGFAAQRHALTGRDHMNADDVRQLILRWRMTVRLADAPLRPTTYEPRRPRVASPPMAPIDEERMSRDIADAKGQT